MLAVASKWKGQINKNELLNTSSKNLGEIKNKERFYL